MCQRASVEQGKHWSKHLPKHFLSSSLRELRHAVEYPCLAGEQQISHTKKPRVDGCGVLYLECPRHRPPLQPENVNLGDGIQGRVVRS